ncbi:cell wall metabolism sensor histidine kinase WalK [Pontibacillus yanchengensis]|uniref:Cell wall metabolism sensor histidine kinase WalK n=2 Tax=Pontibacillus yanchengensis TaxID=462910 RepID=A0ACC7VH17_9BACI|nr:cell wall metabolism sensor histidine kinase WalK [Pontibacillus yanchengensis]MYL34458.1 cell wall metabolism sensor histidine kinase WalK [Pontibacillus yanchengensis]MYL54266.1 cell wall metabolism sensor histidine kinase WalK [Pontibacillus yanchengensis]
MKKVGFFQSIRLKLIITIILLLLFPIQIIGAYFSQQLEEQLFSNFKESIVKNTQYLNYQLEQAFAKERKEDGPTLQEDIQSILSELNFPEEITELQVINNKSRVIGTNNPLDQSIVGKRSTQARVNRTLLIGRADENVVFNKDTGDRTLVMTFPIFQQNNLEQKENIVGVIYLEATLEGVYEQLQDINQIFANGTFLGISISALLGIVIARTITKPITEMRKQAKIMGTGDFSQKVNVYGRDEIGQLAMSFNELNDKLKLSQATTEGERRKLSSVLANMTEGVIATDHRGTIILMNEPASRLIGKSFEKVQGQSLLDVLHIHDRLDDISEIQDTGSIIIDFSEGDQQLLLKASFSMVQYENEEMNGFITVLSDVTEQEKLERERREFVANVSHELRTPLTTMRSYLEALTDGAWEDKEIAPRFLDVTQNETERMIRLVNDLLQLSKMDNKDYRLNKEQVYFNKFFKHIIDRFEFNKEDHIQFVRNLPDEDVWVWADKDKMTQVMDNIISNAIKYSPEGGTITFTAEVKPTQQKLYIKISDEGMGIPKENTEKIFERFYRVDKARSRKLGGTGLGLAISREMIEAHEGNIWAESKEGEGTTILFTLPLMNDQRRDDE